jgi:nucleoside-diphosphate-sugar epimerase
VRILILGGTGTIGAPLVRELLRSGHEVTALARSADSARQMAATGAAALAGDMAAPDHWIDFLSTVDAVIHAAAAFSPEDEAIEWHLLQTLLPALRAARQNKRFIYTGGCWLFGAGGQVATTEASPFAPLAPFAYMVKHAQLALEAPDVHPVVIHPAMVYEPAGGVFRRFHADAMQGRRVRVVGSESVRWPLVHSHDLAVLYRLALERSEPRESYLGAAIEGLPVGDIARAFAKRFRTSDPEPEVVTADAIALELGEWARGYALDQRQSGDKARRRLGWQPRHLDPEKEIASMPVTDRTR